MAFFKITAYPAKPSDSGFSVVMHLDNTPDPMPPAVFEASTLAEVQQHFAAFMDEARAKPDHMAVHINLISGRAPNGFKAWRTAGPTYHRVNV